MLVAVLPALTGLGAGGFADAADLEPAFRTAMLTCAALLALGGVVAALGVRPVPQAVGAQPPAGPRRHCAVDAPPMTATDRSVS
jgi:hypothetical protein